MARVTPRVSPPDCSGCNRFAHSVFLPGSMRAKVIDYGEFHIDRQSVLPCGGYKSAAPMCGRRDDRPTLSFTLKVGLSWVRLRQKPSPPIPSARPATTNCRASLFVRASAAVIPLTPDRCSCPTDTQRARHGRAALSAQGARSCSRNREKRVASEAARSTLGRSVDATRWSSPRR